MGPAAPTATSALAALADQDLMASVLDAWCKRQGREPGGRWRREYARYHPGEDPWSVCLFEGAGGNLVRIDALLLPDAADFVHPVLGPLRIAQFPDDPALPSLGDVMAMLDWVQVVRYRPGKRCTLRGFADGSERFVKVIPGGERIYADALILWAGSRAGAFSFVVAEPFGWHEPTSSFWQGVVPGRPVVQEVFGADGSRFSRRLGAALGELAASKLTASVRNPVDEQLQRTTRSMTRTAMALPKLEHRLAQVHAELERRHARLPNRALVPIHGAPNVHRWLIQSNRLGLTDFDRFALGDPESDLMTFMAELDTGRALVQPVAEIEDAWIEGFESKGPRLDPGLTRLYRIHKRLSKVTRAAWDVQPDAAQRAEQYLQTVELMLSEG